MKKRFLTKTIFLFLLLSTLFSVFGSGQAAEPRSLEVRYPQIPGLSSPPRTVKTMLPDYLQYLFRFIIVLSGFVAFTAFIRGAVKIYLSVGNPAMRKIARKEVFNSLLGLFIILASFILARSVNPALIRPRPTIKGVSGVTLYEGSTSCERGTDTFDDQKATLTVDTENIKESESIAPGDLKSLRFNGEPGTLEVIIYEETDYEGDSQRLKSVEAGTECQGLDQGLDFPVESIRFIWHLPGLYLCNRENGYILRNGDFLCLGDNGDENPKEVHLSYDTDLLGEGVENNVQGARLEKERVLLDIFTPSLCESSLVGEHKCSKKYGGGEVDWVGGPLAEGRYCWCSVFEYAAIFHKDPKRGGKAELIKRPEGGENGLAPESTLQEFTKDFLQDLSSASSNPLTGQDISYDLTKTSSVTVFSPGKGENPPGGVWLCQDPDPRKTQNPKCAGPYKKIMGSFEKSLKEENDRIFNKDVITGVEFDHDFLNDPSCGSELLGENGVSSLIIDGNYIVILFYNPDFRGKAEVFKRSDPDLDDNVMGGCCVVKSVLGRDDCASSAIILPVRGTKSTSGWTPTSCKDQGPKRPEDTEVCSTSSGCEEGNWGSGGNYCCKYEDADGDGCLEWNSSDCQNCQIDTGSCSCQGASTCSDMNGDAESCRLNNSCIYRYVDDDDNCKPKSEAESCDTYTVAADCTQNGLDCYLWPDDTCHSKPQTECDDLSKSDCLDKETCYWNYGYPKSQDKGCYDSIQPCDNDRACTLSEGVTCLECAGGTGTYTESCQSSQASMGCREAPCKNLDGNDNDCLEWATCLDGSNVCPSTTGCNEEEGGCIEP